MAKKRSRKYSFGKKKTHRKRSSFGMGGVLSPIIAGALVGAGTAMLAPTINAKVPSIGPIPSTAVAIGGAGLIAKALLHKDPMHLSSAAIIMAAGITASGLASGYSGNSGGETAF